VAVPFPVYPYFHKPPPNAGLFDPMAPHVQTPKVKPEHRTCNFGHMLMEVLLMGALAGLMLLSWQDTILDYLRSQLLKWKEAWV
jgi:hypothetical protein